MAGLELVLEWVTLIAFVALGVVTFVLWQQRKDRPSFWMFLTFLDLSVVVVVGEILELFEGQESMALDYAQKILVAVLLLFPYSLYRVAHSFAAGARIAHWVAAIPTAIVVAWTFFVPRFPEEGEPRPDEFQVFAYAILFQWVLCSLLVAIRFWRAGTGQPPVTRKRMRTLALAATALSIGIVISVTSSGERDVGVDIAIRLFSLVSVAAFFFAFVPPAWLRASWRRESEESSRRAVIDLMGAVTDQAVVDVLLPHAASLIGAEGVAMFDTEGNVVGTHGGADKDWTGLSVDDDDTLEEAGLTKLSFPFGCLLIKTTPYTLFFGRDEVELVGALGVMTNLALERVRASEMRLELAEAQIRRQQALEINDNVVQGLAVAKYAFDLGDQAKAKEAIEGTLAAARRIISDLLDEVSTDDVFGPNALTRDVPATGYVKKES